MREFIKTIYLFLLGGTIYLCSELLFRGRSHWSMFILGGLCFCCIGGINEGQRWDVPLTTQMFTGAAIITTFEFLAGVLLNIILGLDIWNYSNMPCNILGQICLPFSVLWFFVSGIAVVVDDYTRYLLFGEEKPRYHLF